MFGDIGDLKQSLGKDEKKQDKNDEE